MEETDNKQEVLHGFDNDDMKSSKHHVTFLL